MAALVPDLLAIHSWCFNWHWWPRYWGAGAIGWGTLALINAGLAQAKGRSGLFWFLASLIGGPVATLLLVSVYADGRRL
jgi:hypothetical protein